MPRVIMRAAVALAAAAAASSAAVAQGMSAPLPPVTIGGASIGAVDVERDAAFYEAVFGFKEIRRIDARPEFLEIVLKPGADPKAARNAAGPALILISHPASTAADIPGLQGWARGHLLLLVPDMAPVLAATVAHGGKVAIAASVARGSLASEVDAHPDAVGTHVDAMIEDPEGDFVELLAAR